MALTVTLDTTKTPNELKVVSDRRIVTVTAAGDTATAIFPVKINDGSARVWTLKGTDDGVTAVYTG